MVDTKPPGTQTPDDASRDAREGRIGRETTLDLLRRAQAGDQEALGILCEHLLPPLRRWAGGRIPPWARDLLDTDDLVQETLLRTIRRLDAFEPRHDGALWAYLRQAVHNRICEEVRRAGRRPPRSEAGPDLPDPVPSPLEEAVGREALERYEAALGRLDAREREAIILRIEMGLSYPELAAAMDKPSANAARMAVSRALIRLAREMGHGS
jgi:RNA polymerase sigma-70 factor (ECF subfamily)